MYLVYLCNEYNHSVEETEGLYDSRHTASSQIASNGDAAVVKQHSLKTESPSSTVCRTSCGIQNELFRKSSSG